MTENKINENKNGLTAGIMNKVKTLAPYLAPVVIIILQIFFYFDQSAVLTNLETKINSTSLEVKTIKNTVTREFADLEDSLKAISADIQKLNAIHQDQAKAMSAFSEDTAFLKKWIVENNTTTLKSIDELKRELNSLKKSIEYIRTKINTLQNSPEKPSSQTSSAMNVEAVSI